mgnify:CR=1 FL=1
MGLKYTNFRYLDIHVVVRQPICVYQIMMIALYEETKQKRWSQTITDRRLRLYGHVMRLPESTPIRQSITEYERPLKMARGAPKFTWARNISNDINKLGLDLTTAKSVLQDRQRWRLLIRNRCPD